VSKRPNNVSAAGVLLPCPFCGEHLEAWGVNYRHSIDSNCLLAFASVRVSPTEVKAWNRRAAANTQAMGQAVQEPVAWTTAERLETLRRDGSRARTMWGADLAGPHDVPLYAAPSPAAREAGDGVMLTDEQRTTIQHAADKLRTVWANHTGYKESRELCHKLEDLLREAGSR